MQSNALRVNRNVTAGGAPAFPKLTPLQALSRSVLSCMLFEDEAYEDGQTIADRIAALSKLVTIPELSALAVQARSEYNLRHVSLLLAVCLAGRSGEMPGKSPIAQAICDTIQRADEMAEFLALYWRNGRCPISKQAKKGLAMAMQKFGAHAIAKYDREKAVRIRDVMFMVHPKPKDGSRARALEPVTKDKYKRGAVLRHTDGQGATWGELVNGTLAAPDTWEVALSGGADKKATFERMIGDGSLGYLALLRNLRGMVEAGVATDLIKAAVIARKNGAERVLPFRYVAAARACPQLEPAIDQALNAAIAELPVLPGKTVVLVDVSGSMDTKLSGKSDMQRIDAACALASLINGDVRMFSFSDKIVEVPPRRGMAGVDALIKSQHHSGTALAEAVRAINQNVGCDRLIVITDEQATTGGVPASIAPKSYMVNVASHKNGVGYGTWTHVDGFSEAIIRFIIESEREQG